MIRPPVLPARRSLLRPIPLRRPPPPPPLPPPPVTMPPSPPPPPTSTDPYDPNFDCNAASPDQRAEHNRLAALSISAYRVTEAGFGNPGGSTGYNNKEYGSFTYRLPSGEIVASQPIEGSGTSINTIQYGQSTPGGPYDEIITPSETIPIAAIVGFTHNHPTSQSQGNQAEYPLPSTVNIRNTPNGQQASGDYAFAQQLIQLGADPNLQLGIFAESTAGGGYALRVYPYTATPPYDPNNPATWGPAYGPTVPLNLQPCP